MTYKCVFGLSAEKIGIIFSEAEVSVQRCVKKAVNLHFKGLPHLSLNVFNLRLHILLSLIMSCDIEQARHLVV